MKSRKPDQHSTIMKHLSPVEQRIHLMAKRHRAEFERCIKRLYFIRTKARHILLVAACAGGFVGTNATPLRAAEPVTVSVPALFNEANEAQRAGRLGSAILKYERASFLAPGDQGIAQNLSAARQKAGVAAPSVPLWQRPAHWLSFNTLAGLASISLLLFSLLFFGTRFIPTTLRRIARGVAATLGVTALLAVGAEAVRWPELGRAVIVASSPSGARIAPAANAAVSSDLKQGEIVRVEESYGQFVRVRAADGRTGWLPAREIEKIIPAVS